MNKEKTNKFVFPNPVSDETVIYGGVAQLGEHLPCKQGVRGSNPLISTDEKQKLSSHFVP